MISGRCARPAGLLSLALALVAGCDDHPPRSVANRPWPAPVAAGLPKESPVLEPEQALATFTMVPGYQVELVAAEPLVQDPILAEFDGDGRLWVLELHGFAYNENMDNSLDPINDLVILEDTDQNGVYDTRTVFLDHLVLPRAFKVLDKTCALVGEPPDLWRACDTDGDLRSDTKELISDSFSRRGVLEHGANGLYWGMDNTIVVSEHSWSLRYENGSFRTFPTPVRGQWGVTQDNAGRIFRDVNTDPLFVDYLAPEYYARNPNMVRTRGLYDNLVDQEKTQVWPARPTLGLNRGYRRNILRADDTTSYYGGVSSPMIYRGERLPQELRNQALVVDGPTNLVHLLRLRDDGLGRLSAEDYYPRGELMTSTDERFRPVSLTPGWDGTFYIVDMYRGVSQDGPIQTDYLRNYIVERKLWQHVNLGRIYRVVHDGMGSDERPHMSGETPAQLVGRLSHPNGWWRDTAQQLLVQRADLSVVPALKELVQSSPSESARLQALWTLSGLGALDAATIARARGDESPAIRAAGVRLTEPALRTGDPAARAAVLALADDPTWTVRRQVTASLGELPTEQRLAPILSMLEARSEDPVLVDAAVSGLAGLESEALDALLATPDPSAAAAAMLAGALGRRRDPATTERLLALAADGQRPAALRQALLAGLRLGLDGADGSDTSGTVAGGRAGGGVPGLAAARPSVIRVTLESEPAALAALAASGSGDLAQAASAVLAVLGWPGKPRPAAAPRTAAEQQLFDRGREIYASVCAACHAETGEGIDKLGARLAGSPLVGGRPNVIVQILLNGKEGKLGLMPPAGAPMSDEDVAAVATYVRGSFGNVASPVAPPQVLEWRQAYAFRATPWTEEELAAAAGPPGPPGAPPR